MQAVLFVFLLLIASVCDLRKREIPDWVNGAIAVASLLCFQPVNLWGVIPSLFFLAGAMKGGIGGGDVKLAAACGLVLGLPAALAGTILGLSLLLLFHWAASAISICYKKKAAAVYPLAPFLALGYMAAYYLKSGGQIG